MSKEITTVNNQVATTKAGDITALFQAIKDQFLAVNAGLELDFVRMGQWLKLNKKGQFVQSADETVNYGDTLDVVVAVGEVRYVLWGKTKSPEAGQLLVAEKKQEDAEEVLTRYLEEHPEANERYSLDDIKLNYLMQVVLVNTLSDGDLPDIYIVSLPQTASYTFGQYAMSVFKGNKDKGILRNTGVNAVVTRIGSKEEKNKDGESYVTFTFEAVGTFNPADYGIKVE